MIRSSMRARMMQPARQIDAISPRSRRQPYCALGDAHLLETLLVGDDLGGVERVADRLDVRRRGLARRALRMREEGLRLGAQLPPARQRAGVYRFGDRGDRHAEIERRLGRPAPGSLLLGFVEDPVDERRAGRVRLVQHLGGDVDEVGIERARLPALEHVADLRRGQSVDRFQEIVGLGDQLHVGIFDAVVHHLDVVARAVGADIGAAGTASRLAPPSWSGTARSARRPRGRRPASCSGPCSAPSSPPETPMPTKRIRFASHALPRRIVSVNRELPASIRMSSGSRCGASSSMTSSTGLPAWTRTMTIRGVFERRDELRDALRRNEPPLAAVLAHQRVGAFGVAVEQRHAESVARRVAGQIGAHHRQSEDAEIGFLLRCCHGDSSRGGPPPVVKSECGPRLASPPAGYPRA